jgi:hypothetical protein
MKKCSIVAVFVLLFSCPALVWAADFTGTWDTTYGPLTMIQKGKEVTGSYYDGKAELQGTVAKNRLKFHYQEQTQGGEGEFVLAEDGNSFTGKWRVVGTTSWNEWNGTRK